MAAVKERAIRTPYIAFFVVLIALAFAADPYSFAKAWNEGRSATLAIVPLVFLEAGRRSLSPLGGTRRPLAAWLTLLVAGAYYFAFAQPSVVGAVVSLGNGLGVDPYIIHFSWVWGIDYAVTSVLLVALLLLDSGPKTITPAIYTVGMASFLFIDVLLPANTLGPFGLVVPPALQMVAGLLDRSGLGTASSQGNVLSLQNSHGSMNLQVFWPSAGLDGIVIGLLVVVAICVKAGTGWTRGAVYVVVGAIGSFLVNVVRLVLLALYAMTDIADPRAFEAFHSVVGELVFIPWIILFVIVILKREGRMSMRHRPLPGA